MWACAGVGGGERLSAQEGPFTSAFLALHVASLPSQPQEHQVCQNPCPSQAWWPPTLFLHPDFRDAFPFPRAYPTPRPQDSYAHCEYLLKQLCPPGCLLPAVYLSVCL